MGIMRSLVWAIGAAVFAVAVGFALYRSEAFKVMGIALSWIVYIAVLLAPIGIPLMLWRRGLR
jgi:hypothetical protein